MKQVEIDMAHDATDEIIDGFEKLKYIIADWTDEEYLKLDIGDSMSDFASAILNIRQSLKNNTIFHVED